MLITCKKDVLASMPDDPDRRDYRVSFDKIKEQLGHKERKAFTIEVNQIIAKLVSY